MKDLKFEEINVPRLDQDVKEMNGKSTRHLKQCIDHLTELLEDKDETTAKRPSGGADVK